MFTGTFKQIAPLCCSYEPDRRPQLVGNTQLILGDSRAHLSPYNSSYKQYTISGNSWNSRHRGRGRKKYRKVPLPLKVFSIKNQTFDFSQDPGPTPRTRTALMNFRTNFGNTHKRFKDSMPFYLDIHRLSAFLAQCRGIHLLNVYFRDDRPISLIFVCSLVSRLSCRCWRRPWRKRPAWWSPPRIPQLGVVACVRLAAPDFASMEMNSRVS